MNRRALTLALLLAACSEEVPASMRVVGGDANRGAALVKAHGCAACHTIPGVPGPRGIVGPPLERFGERAFIGGVLPNTPDTLVRWVMDAPALLPGTAMPDLPVSEAEAKDIAAFLVSLR